MSVFISYAHQDEALALLLSHMLQEKGVDCLVDRTMAGGDRIDSSIQHMIRQADVLLVLLTQSSVSSSWVNQEIGFATGCGTPVWPLAVQREI